MAPSTRRRPAAPPAACLAAAALLAAVLAGCSRADRLDARIDAVRDDRARTLLRDTLWKHGSKYAWAEAGSLRAEVTWTEHRPLGRTSRSEVWTVDPLTGHCRIEVPAADETIVRDTWGLRVRRDGNTVTDPLARARAAGRVRVAAELLPMPASLPAEGREILSLGTRAGPADARRWHRLMVTYGRGASLPAGDRMVVEIGTRSGRVARVLIRWSEPPFVGRPMRVEMDDWRPVGDLLVSRRWRFIPVDDAGRPAGPARYTVRLTDVTTGAAAP